MTKLIGIYSSVPQVGKSKVANYLSVYNYKTVSFATTIKTMVRILLKNLGYTSEHVNRFVVENKEEVIPNIGVSARHLMRTLGTEWGRDCVHPDVWKKCWRVAVDRQFTLGHHVVCDDVRFPNEAELVRHLGGQLWHVQRPSAPEIVSDHRSDGGLDDFTFDHTIINDGTLLDLYSQVDTLICPKGQVIAS